MNEARKSLYVESTIPSYAMAWTSKELIAAARQTMTREFWEKERHKYDLYVSQYVIDKIQDGDRGAAQKRLEFVSGIHVYPKTAKVDALAAMYQKLLDIPDKAKRDCNHLAVCILERINYLLTWNCAHLGIPSFLKVREY
jgi:hypothetical protein